MDRSSGPHELSLRYPVYAVLSAEPGGDADGLVVIEVEGNDSLLLFLNREVAELYVEQAQAPCSEAPLTLRACRGDDELEHLLSQLPGSVTHIIWDATPRARALKVTAVAELRAVLRGEGEDR